MFKFQKNYNFYSSSRGAIILVSSETKVSRVEAVIFNFFRKENFSSFSVGTHILIFVFTKAVHLYATYEFLSYAIRAAQRSYCAGFVETRQSLAVRTDVQSTKKGPCLYSNTVWHIMTPRSNLYTYTESPSRKKGRLAIVITVGNTEYRIRT